MDDYDYRSVDRSAELTNFDKLAIRIIITGVVILIILHVALVGEARGLYSPLDELLPGLTRIVFSPGYAASASLLLLYLAYYGARVRRLYNSRSASQVLFFGLLITVAANALLVYGLYSPASGATDMIRNAGRSDDDE